MKFPLNPVDNLVYSKFNYFEILLEVNFYLYSAVLLWHSGTQGWALTAGGMFNRNRGHSIRWQGRSSGGRGVWVSSSTKGIEPSYKT